MRPRQAPCRIVVQVTSERVGEGQLEAEGRAQRRSEPVQRRRVTPDSAETMVRLKLRHEHDVDVEATDPRRAWSTKEAPNAGLRSSYTKSQTGRAGTEANMW